MRFTLLGALLFVCVATACLTPVSEDSEGVPLATWCATRQADFTCNGQVGCGVAAPDAPCDDVAASVVGRTDDNCTSTFVASVDAGRVRYDGAAAQKCRERARSTCDLTRLSWDCEGAFVGTVAEGGACALTVECQPGLRCERQAACMGVCSRLLPDGAAVSSASACASGAAAAGADGGLRCAPVPREGQACLEGVCGLGLSCQSGTCALPPPRGGACDGGQACVFGTLCVQARCVAWAPRGAACASQFLPVDAGAPPCQLGLACRAGRCGDALRDGEPCREEPNRCAGGARCSQSTQLCTRLGAAGAACSSSAACDHLLCVGGQCGPGGELGQSCAPDRPCRPSLTCSNGVCVEPLCF